MKTAVMGWRMWSPGAGYGASGVGFCAPKAWGSAEAAWRSIAVGDRRSASGQAMGLAVLLLIASWLAMAELVPLDRYGDLYREQVFEEQNEAWRTPPSPEANPWRQTPPAPAADSPRVRFGYDPTEEHLRNIQRLEEQNRATTLGVTPSPVFQIGF